MPHPDPLISPAQIRAGRALVNWTQEQLARAADVGVATIRDYESERRGNVVGALRPIEHALNSAGVMFIHTDDDAGAGVRMVGKLPDVRRWPTKRGPQGELSIRVAWKGHDYDVILTETTLEDLAELGHEPDDETYLLLIKKERQHVLKAAADLITANQATPDRRVYVSEPQVRKALSTTRSRRRAT